MMAASAAQKSASCAREPERSTGAHRLEMSIAIGQKPVLFGRIEVVEILVHAVDSVSETGLLISADVEHGRI